MPSSLSDWADRLENQALPAMALTIQRVTQLIERPSTINADYQRVVGKDPGFALAVFRGIEKAAHTPSEPAGNLAHAIALLGISPLIKGTKSLPVLKRPAGTAWQGLHACYSRAGHAAWYAYQWGLARKDTNPEEMAVAALLRACGEMSLWAHARADMEQIQRHTAQGLNRKDAAMAVLGFSLDQLSLALAERWRLPPLVARTLTSFGAFETRSLGVMLASALAQASAANWRSEKTRDLTELVAEYLNQTVDRAMAQIHTQAADAARALQGLPLPASAAVLVQQTQETGAAEMATTPTSVPENKTKRRTPTPPPQSEKDKEQRKPRAGANRLQEAFNRIMRELKESVGIDRTMFAMLTPDRKALRPRLVLGADQTSALRRFQLNLDKPHLFSLLMAKPQGFWLHTGNREKFLPMIPVSLHNSLNLDGFFITSLFIQKQPFGLLYGDCSDATMLDKQRFGLFKKLAHQLSDELSQGRHPV